MNRSESKGVPPDASRSELFAPGGPLPPTSPPSPNDIADELADHLACGQEEFERRGRSSAEAEIEARAAFGDVRTVARELYWLHFGRQIMFQRIMTGALAVALAVASGAAYMSWRNAGRLERELAGLRSQMGAIARDESTVRVRVVDAQGRPLAERRVSFGVPSNYGSYFKEGTARDRKTDARGEIEFVGLSRGEYMVKTMLYPEAHTLNWQGEALRHIQVTESGGTMELDLTVPTVTPRPIELRAPAVDGEQTEFYAQRSLEVFTRLNHTGIRFRRTFQSSDPPTVELPDPGGDATLTIDYRLVGGKDKALYQTQRQTFDFKDLRGDEPTVIELPTGGRVK